MVIKGIVKHFGKLIRKAEENIIEKIDDGRLETEPSITERFLQEIERVFEEYGEHNGIYFAAFAGAVDAALADRFGDQGGSLGFEVEATSGSAYFNQYLGRWFKKSFPSSGGPDYADPGL